MTQEQPNHDSYSILVIDDDAFLLDMYALKFSQKNFLVTSASGTLQALEMLRGGLTPQIVVVDLVMPAMDGFEFLEVVRSESLAKGALLIILSNLGQQEDIDRGLALGAQGYIIKASATPSEVVEKVEEALERRGKNITA
jgi:DNA-binding response OmpR family regulator